VSASRSRSKLWEVGWPLGWGEYARARSKSRVPYPTPTAIAPPNNYAFEWEPGFDKVGDCVWPWHPSDIAIKKKLALEVVQNFKNIESRPVIVTGVPRRKGRRAKPYEPIEYAALWPKYWTAYDEQISTVKVLPNSSGIMLETIVGAERIDVDYDSFPDKNVPIEIPRVPDCGIFIHYRDLDGHDLFHIKQFPGMLVCTDRFHDFIFERKVTNIILLEIGDVID
jgi:hypothetical protein